MGKYLAEFAVVACVSGVLGYFSDKLNGGFQKLISLACSLALMCVILVPIINELKSMEEIRFPEVSVTEEYEDAEEYYKALQELTEEKLKSEGEKEIFAEFGYDGEDISLEFSGKVHEGVYELSHITLTILSVKALAHRDELVKFLEEKYRCVCKCAESMIARRGNFYK